MCFYLSQPAGLLQKLGWQIKSSALLSGGLPGDKEACGGQSNGANVLLLNDAWQSSRCERRFWANRRAVMGHPMSIQFGVVRGSTTLDATVVWTSHQACQLLTYSRYSLLRMY